MDKDSETVRRVLSAKSYRKRVDGHAKTHTIDEKTLNAAVGLPQQRTCLRVDAKEAINPGCTELQRLGAHV